MVKIGTVWDRTTEVIGGRAGELAGIAALTLFAPSVASAAITAFAPGRPVLSFVVTILVTIVALWGTLGMNAVASDPAIDRAAAYRAGTTALPRGILVLIVALAAVSLIAVPAIVLLQAAGFDWAAAQRGEQQTAMEAGKAGGFVLYCLAAGIAMLWIGARLCLLYPVLLNERRGIGSFGRSFALTRGLTWKIIGVLILYFIVLAVVLLASTAVSGLIFRLILGAESQTMVSFLAGIVGAVVTAVFGVLQTVFVAQLFVAARGEREAMLPA